MTDTAAVQEASAEFPSDEHRDSHIAGLRWEITGYQARVDGAADELVKAAYVARIADVQAELDRVLGDKPKPKRTGS